ncbi:MAG TPA: Lrp/AsnC family transcriptional regulator [Bryobacteraceae bacterium]|nr:Lrp/AsnC family transcriptional regulator [Bryobacteraceae bacterium]
METVEMSPLIDEIARKLLDALQRNARASYAELGRLVGLSPSATAERLRRLEDAGIIRGYRANLDPAGLGLGITALIRMTADGVQYRQLMNFLGSCEPVRECYHVTGGDALMMKVMVQSIQDLEGLITNLLHYGVPTTSIVLSTPIFRDVYQLRPRAAAEKATKRKLRPPEPGGSG